MAQPDFKPDKRIVDPGALTRKLHRDKVCRRCNDRADQPHHIVHKKSHRGDDVEDNIMPLCWDCHMFYHDHGPCTLRITKKEAGYVFAKLGKVKGLDYLQRRYDYPGG